MYDFFPYHILCMLLVTGLVIIMAWPLSGYGVLPCARFFPGRFGTGAGAGLAALLCDSVFFPFFALLLGEVNRKLQY